MKIYTKHKNKHFFVKRKKTFKYAKSTSKDTQQNNLFHCLPFSSRNNFKPLVLEIITPIYQSHPINPPTVQIIAPTSYPLQSRAKDGIVFYMSFTPLPFTNMYSRLLLRGAGYIYCSLTRPHAQFLVFTILYATCCGRVLIHHGRGIHYLSFISLQSV